MKKIKDLKSIIFIDHALADVLKTNSFVALPVVYGSKELVLTFDPNYNYPIVLGIALTCGVVLIHYFFKKNGGILELARAQELISQSKDQVAEILDKYSKPYRLGYYITSLSFLLSGIFGVYQFIVSFL